MSHELDIPDFLNRKLHPEYNERELGPVYLRKERAGIIVPKTSAKPVEKEIGQLSPREQEELVEIKAMSKTNLGIAKRMASEWVQRASAREAQARRRHYLKQIPALQRRVKWQAVE